MVFAFKYKKILKISEILSGFKIKSKSQRSLPELLDLQFVSYYMNTISETIFRKIFRTFVYFHTYINKNLRIAQPSL